MCYKYTIFTVHINIDKIMATQNISTLEPKAIFTFFEEILKIPRPSKHEGQIRQYLRDFASKNNFEIHIYIVIANSITL